MIQRLLPLLLTFSLHHSTRAQRSPAVADIPSPEAFINAIATNLVDSTLDHYFLVVGTDSCRFVKYNYDEWIKYHLSEPLTFDILNELSEKVYLSRYPYFWKQTRLQKAVCVTRKQADSILATNPVFAHRPASQNVVYSFSLPQFTDNGRYAVIDLNLICGAVCGMGYTCIFRLTATGQWRLVGQYTNWDSR
ncbi:MAG TPA: hypothetical protein VNU70_00325 [Puia sp.]|jgi:hypothetical protein|nr:hypothetical protein [Puia sp.]